ncbi:MAG: leucine-rich repeat domain-containing protein [Pseudomonadota bacterium]|nr:leucine-rich repeat domain-containing protein [Pseudomonadota bacterium]
MTMLTQEQVQTIIQANPNATTFKVPEGVTRICSEAFNGCSSLTSIELPKGLKSIGLLAFECCSGLTSIELPEGLESIEEGAFDRCSGLTSIEIPESVTIIGYSVFQYCSGLKSIELPNGLESIRNGAFAYCSGLQSIVIREGVTSIGNRAFRDCSGLKSIVIPDSVTSIGHDAFKGCSVLESIEWPKGLKIIGDEAFYGCSVLESIELPEGLEGIGRGAFRGCRRLISVVIPDSVTNIGIFAFRGLSQLSQIIAPEHLHEQLKREYPDKEVMTRVQYHSALVAKIELYRQVALDDGEKQKLAETVEHLSPGTKASLMALEIPEGQTFSNLSTEALVQCFGDEPASLLPLLGIESKEVALGYSTEVGSVIASHLTVREKILLDATAKGEVLTQIRPNNTVKTSRVISLGQSLEASNDTPDLSDRKPEEQRVDEKPSSSASSPRGHK